MRYVLLAGLAVLSLLVIVSTVVVLRLLATRKQVARRFGAIDVQLRRRHQLVDELLELSQNKAEQFDATRDNLQFLSNRARQVQSPTERENFENALSHSLAEILIAAHGCDEYQDCATYGRLTDQLREVENDLRRSTNFYNDAADRFNTTVDRTAARWLAPLFSIEQQPVLRFDFARAKSEQLQPHLAGQVANDLRGEGMRRPATRASHRAG